MAQCLTALATLLDNLGLTSQLTHSSSLPFNSRVSGIIYCLLASTGIGYTWCTRTDTHKQKILIHIKK